MYPGDSLWELEWVLLGASAGREDVLLKVKEFYQKTYVLSPGLVPEDFMEAIVRGMCDVTS